MDKDFSAAIFLSTPSARRATVKSARCSDKPLFLSTPSARRATHKCGIHIEDWKHFYPRPPRGGRLPSILCCSTNSYFYPRPPRGGRPLFSSFCALIFLISIHALREEGDTVMRIAVCWDTAFLSTPSARRATIRKPSIVHSHVYFYPRPPRGGRLSKPFPDSDSLLFLSTPSARRATSRQNPGVPP